MGLLFKVHLNDGDTKTSFPQKIRTMTKPNMWSDGDGENIPNPGGMIVTEVSMWKKKSRFLLLQLLQCQIFNTD